MLMSEKLTGMMTAWVLLVAIVAPSLELFVSLVLIGILVIRELTDIFVSSDMKARMDIFVYVGLFIFAVMVARKTLNILGL